MALTKQRALKIYRASSIELAGKNEAVHQGGQAFFDTSTGLVAKGFASTTLIPIGSFAESSPAAATKTVLVNLHRELHAVWMKNHGSDTVVAANIGGLAYIVDDDTVANVDATNARSVLGRIWKIDAVKGVLVEPLQSAGQKTVSGLD